MAEVGSRWRGQSAYPQGGKKLQATLGNRKWLAVAGLQGVVESETPGKGGIGHAASCHLAQVLGLSCLIYKVPPSFTR